MQSKKGIYLIAGLISTILIFFFILFFVHENTLENGILFTVSFEYEDGKDIKYNFYNQNGKIEKEENENKFLLKKTDYNSVKLLRKITKKLKESKNPWKEEGISIYNGQNKRYYLIPYQSEAAIELSNYIIDGYIHAELNRTTQKVYNEIYMYIDQNNTYKYTKDGNQENIIHTYSCESDNCEMIAVAEQKREAILFDNKYYFYNYESNQKDLIEVEFDIKRAKILNWNDQTLGIELKNEKLETIYYDLKRKRALPKEEKMQYSIVNEDLILKNKQKANELELYDLQNDKIIWKKEMSEKDNPKWTLLKTTMKEQTIYFLKNEGEKTAYYYVLDEKGNTLLNNKKLELDESEKIMIFEKDIIKDGEDHYHVYDKNGNFLETLAISY